MYIKKLTHLDQIISLASKQGMIRPLDIKSMGIARARLNELLKLGVLERHGRGIYALRDMSADEHLSLAEACKQVPNGVVCLLSALAFHQIGTQIPRSVWLAIDRKSRKPGMSNAKIHFVRFSGAALTEGIERHESTAGVIRVYNPAKTIVDCFRYRNKIGLDVALEALREGLRERKTTADDIWRCAAQLRQITVIRPYLEAISA